IPFPSSPSQCDVLFISNSHFEVWPEIRPNINGLPILTIAMQNTFCELGGMIQIEQRENTLKFSINLKEARQNHLDIRSALLKLAEKVY
ncbi:MAG: YfiR family protein, partial [Bdellovibrionales bacterium]|nr:YfiR family protein [Bdellovibrionales bacterium]